MCPFPEGKKWLGATLLNVTFLWCFFFFQHSMDIFSCNIFNNYIPCAVLCVHYSHVEEEQMKNKFLLVDTNHTHWRVQTCIFSRRNLYAPAGYKKVFNLLYWLESLSPEHFKCHRHLHIQFEEESLLWAHLTGNFRHSSCHAAFLFTFWHCMKNVSSFRKVDRDSSLVCICSVIWWRARLQQPESVAW